MSARQIDVSFNKEGFEKLLQEMGVMYLSIKNSIWTRYTVMVDDAQARQINKFANNYC